MEPEAKTWKNLNCKHYSDICDICDTLKRGHKQQVSNKRDFKPLKINALQLLNNKKGYFYD